MKGTELNRQAIYRWHNKARNAITLLWPQHFASAKGRVNCEMRARSIQSPVDPTSDWSREILDRRGGCL